MPLDQEQLFPCPYCSRPNRLTIDLSAGSKQEFVIDCETCCAPILIKLKFKGIEMIFFNAMKENE